MKNKINKFCIRFIFIIIIIFLIIPANLHAKSQELNQKSSYNWDDLKSTYDEFLVEQTNENKQKLLNVLPDNYVEEIDIKTSNYILNNFTPIEVLAKKGDLLGLKILYKFRFISDGAILQYIYQLIGSSIVSNPENFLIALQENLDDFTHINNVLAGLGDEYADKYEKRTNELLNRFIAINNVQTNKQTEITKDTKYFCLYILSRSISRDTRYMFDDDKVEWWFEKYQ